MQTFHTLPFEILNQIVENFDDVQTLLSFSRVSKRFHGYAKQDGFRVFILKQHPSYQKAGGWNDAVHSLTALSRAWDTKAFVARNLRPPNTGTHVVRLPQDVIPTPAGGRQSMGYQPVMDCYESWLSGANHEVLVWGAGSELIVRTKSETARKRPERKLETIPVITSLDGRLQWIQYKPADMLDGRDDITAAKLLRPGQYLDDGKSHAIVGRASGHLQHITIDGSGAEIQDLSFNRLSIDCADVSPSNDPIVAACQDNRRIILHRLSAMDPEQPQAEFEFPSKKQTDTIWTVRYLSSTLLAVGQGTTKRPISLLEITPTGLVDKGFPLIGYNASDSIYAIEPLEDNSNLFLSGHFSGHVQLNDMRIANGRAAVYDDPVDCSPIYSLLPMTGPRFIAGGARHCLLKFFDMRRPNWSCSSYTVDHNSTSRNGYNIFLPTIGTRMTRTSPTYCLSATSPHASSFYAGIENGVVQIDLHSTTNAHARPSVGIPLLDRDSPTRAQLEKETESLRLVEHATDGVPVLLRQTNLGHQRQSQQKLVSGYDDRWAEDVGYDSYQSVRQIGRGGRGHRGAGGRGGRRVS